MGRLRAFVGFLAMSAMQVGAAEVPTADLAGFRKSIAPFLAAHCTSCHGERKREGKLTLHAIDGDLVGGANLDTWQTILERLKAGDMPPPEQRQPAPDSVKVVTDWIEAELVKAGRSGVLKAGSLKTGNHVPHDLLFGPREFPLESPARLWRMSPSIYGEMVKDINKNLKVSQPFSLPAGDGFRDVSGSFGIDEPTAAQLLRNAEAIVNDQLGLSGRGRKIKEFEPLLDEKATPTRKAVETAVRKEFDIVLHRPPTDADLQHFVEFHAVNVKTGGAATGARVTLMAVFMQPEALFRFELGSGASGAQGRRMLSPRELAFAIAYALTDRAPDATLLKAADSGKLATREDVQREAARLFADPKVEKPRMLRFFREYFGYADAANVFKEKKEFPAHEANLLVRDTDRLVQYILEKDQNVLVELLTTNKSFVAYQPKPPPKKGKDGDKKPADAKVVDAKDGGKKPAKKDLGRAHHLSYNVEEQPADEAQPVTLPADQRAGILTQPSWLVANSDNFNNHAIRRGKWIRERLLGGTVPDLPITVDAQLPEDPHKTLRQRMEVTKQAYCMQCHQRMNPLGLAFENFDHFGRARREELGKPVDATGLIERSGDPKLDGSVNNSLEMIRKLAGSERVRQVFVRYAFRYWMGRDETLGDAASLREIDKAYVASGGSMKALVTAILTSDSFLYRTNTTTTAAAAR